MTCRIIEDRGIFLVIEEIPGKIDSCYGEHATREAAQNQSEILAEVESVNFARTEGLEFYIGEERRIEQLDFVSVVSELKRHYKFDSKKTTIASIADNGLFSVK